MGTYENNIKKAGEILKTQRYYNSIGALMSWDLWQGLPARGRGYRQEVSGYFTKEKLNLISGNETKKVVEYLRELDDSRYENIYHKAAARNLIKNYDRAVKIPVDLQIEMNNFTSEAQLVWKDALSKSDFDLYKPYIKRLFELKTKVAQSINKEQNPFDVLVGDVDEGLTVGRVDRLFSELKIAVVDILNRVREKNEETYDRILNLEVDKETVKRVCTKIVEEAFFDKDKATYWEVIHPVCIGVGPNDIRITTNFNKLFSGIFSMLHECGHGVYEYSSNKEVVDMGIWGGISGAMHESQSRFYENIIGKSPEFWTYFYPMLQEEVKGLRNVDLCDFYGAINRVRPTLRRIEADELTYNLHPIIRFEMEKEYFLGKLSTDDFYEAWNAKYKEYLGIEPQNAKDGVLQDVHWASGHIGYFQSYTLGNIYGGQFRNKMLEDIPDLYARIAKGDFSLLNAWNYENIHQYGNLYSPNDLIVKITGEEIQSKYFIEYLYNKFAV